MCSHINWIHFPDILQMPGEKKNHTSVTCEKNMCEIQVVQCKFNWLQPNFSVLAFLFCSEWYETSHSYHSQEVNRKAQFFD